MLKCQNVKVLGILKKESMFLTHIHIHITALCKHQNDFKFLDNSFKKVFMFPQFHYQFYIQSHGEKKF